MAMCVDDMVCMMVIKPPIQSLFQATQPFFSIRNFFLYALSKEVMPVNHIKKFVIVYLI